MMRPRSNTRSDQLTMVLSRWAPAQCMTLHLLNGLLHQALTGAVKGTGGLIKNQQQGPGQKALALAPGRR